MSESAEKELFLVDCIMLGAGPEQELNTTIVVKAANQEMALAKLEEYLLGFPGSHEVKKEIYKGKPIIRVKHNALYYLYSIADPGNIKVLE